MLHFWYYFLRQRMLAALLEVRPKREPEDGPVLMPDFPMGSSAPAERFSAAVVCASLR